MLLASVTALMVLSTVALMAVPPVPAVASSVRNACRILPYWSAVTLLLSWAKLTAPNAASAVVCAWVGL